MPLFKRKSLLGIDIGSYSVKLVELGRSKSRFILKALGEIAIPHNIFNLFLESQNKECLNILSLYISKLVEDSKCNTKNVVAAIPSKKFLLLLLNFRQYPRKKLIVQ